MQCRVGMASRTSLIATTQLHDCCDWKRQKRKVPLGVDKVTAMKLAPGFDNRCGRPMMVSFIRRYVHIQNLTLDGLKIGANSDGDFLLVLPSPLAPGLSLDTHKRD